MDEAYKSHVSESHVSESDAGESDADKIDIDFGMDKTVEIQYYIE